MPDPSPIRLATLLDELPPEWPNDVLPTIHAEAAALGRMVVALDDDPTGTQTVHGIDVLTEWSVPSLVDVLSSDASAFYILTNSRALPTVKAVALAYDIGGNLAQAARQTGRDVCVISRSDSTLRGHYPAEVDAVQDALARGLGVEFHGQVVAPFFYDGGRLTAGDVHYVREGDILVPAAQTEFARDAVFGYRASNLRDWVAEKTDGRVAASAVRSISLDDIRRGGPDRVAERFTQAPVGAVTIVNAMSERDIEVAALGALRAETAGRRFVYRTAASFVRARAGIPRRGLLTAQELVGASAGGALVVVGSYIQKSSAQLTHLLALPQVVGIELSVADILVGQAEAAAGRAAGAANAAIEGGQVAVVYTSRGLVTGSSAEASLGIGHAVSEALSQVVRSIQRGPGFVVAKGGITSSDTATQGLGIRRAHVLGQILPGVPVWQAGAESRWPGVPYIVFPGNVGGPEAMATVVSMLSE